MLESKGELMKLMQLMEQEKRDEKAGEEEVNEEDKDNRGVTVRSQWRGTVKEFGDSIIPEQHKEHKLPLLQQQQTWHRGGESVEV